MALSEWRKVHQGRVYGSMYIGIAVGVLAKELVGGNALVQFLVSFAVGMTTIWVAPIVFWFFAADGRKAQP